MKSDRFRWLLRKIKIKPDLKVYLETLSRDQFAELIRNTLRKNKFVLIQFNKNFVHAERQHIYAVYVKAFKQRNSFFTTQLDVLIISQNFNFKKRLNMMLLEAAIDGRRTDVLQLLNLGLCPNDLSSGRAIIHVACQFGHIGLLSDLLMSSIHVIDADFPDRQGNYPLSILCNQGSIAGLQVFFAAEHMRYYAFQDLDAGGYNEKLDPIKIAIDNDNAGLLEFLLRRTHDEVFGESTVLSLTTMRDYAIEQNHSITQSLLNSYLEIVRAGRELFPSVSAAADVRALANNRQSVTKVDYSTLSSAILLCKRYEIEIIIKNNQKRHLKSKQHDINQIFQRLKPMIERATANGYWLYHINDAGQAVKKVLMTDKEFKGHATNLFNSINNGKAGKYGSYATWRSSWFQADTEDLKFEAGLSVKEIWALAVLAAQDKNCISGVELTISDISAREQLLVRALVDCQRAYNCNNDYSHDMGGKADPSCVHGVFLRALLSLSRLHDDIRIETSALSWASEIAQAQINEIYSIYDAKEIFDSCRNLESFQRTDEQQAVLEDFYILAGCVIREKLVADLGLVKNGGYLFNKELEDILTSIEFLRLPTIKAAELLAKDYNEFDRVITGAPIYGIKQEILEQYVLPATPDAVFAAILLSAADLGISLPRITTVKKLRKQVAQFIDAALNEPQRLLTLNIKGLKNHAAVKAVGASVRQRLKNICDNNYAHTAGYISAIRGYGNADTVIMTVISALYDTSVILYSIDGVPVNTINSQIIFLPTTVSDVCLRLCVHSRDTDNGPSVDFNYANALLSAGAWQQLRSLLFTFGIFNQQQHLEQDHNIYKNYKIMPDRNVAGLQQIKIPGHGSSMFKAVLLAAKNAGIPRATEIDNHYDLRKLVMSEISLRLASINYADLDPLTLQLIDLASDADADAYIQNMLAPNTEAGELELILMTEVLLTNIVLHVAGKPEPQIFGDYDIRHTLHLHRIADHYNILVAVNTWQDLGPASSILRFSTPIEIDNVEEEHAATSASSVAFKRPRFSGGVL